MSMKDAYQQKLEVQLEEWKADIDKMKAKADQADADVKIEYHDRIEDLQLKQEAAQEKLKELREAGEGAWEDLKTGVELAWTSLGEAVKSVKSRFK